MSRTDEAHAVLVENDRGRYTVPSPRLYPFQWNWDSAFTALGWAEIDISRAWIELQSLFEAQWPSGMVPHIVFWSDESTYFPGPEVWSTDAQAALTPAGVATSGLSQPPVAATVVRRLAQHDPGPPASLLDALDASHRWWHSARDPTSLGVIAVSHPWESGRDNVVDWDAPLAAVDVGNVAVYRRRDLDHVDQSMRPSQADYDRYVALVEFGASSSWSDAVVASDSPFWVADPGVTAILLRAERDLAALLMDAGRDTTDIDRRILGLEQGYERFWNPAAGTYCSFDIRTGRHATEGTSASFLAAYAGVATHRDELLVEFAAWSEACTFAVPSHDPRSPSFEPNRYWRGPIWLVMNHMIATGFSEIGADAQAERIRVDSRNLVETAGFAESFNPVTGGSVGGKRFSWTAALWLAWARH